MATAFLAGYMVKAAQGPAPKAPGLDKMHKAVGYAETGHLKDPYVRTGYSKGKGSSAWGTHQLGNMLTDYTPDTNPGFYSKLQPAERNHLNKLHNQRTAMLHFGKEPQKRGYHPKWEYSDPKKPGQGAGYFGNITPQQKQLHASVTRSIMEDQIRRRGFDPKTVSLAQVAKIWQGSEMPAAHRANWMNRARQYIKSH